MVTSSSSELTALGECVSPEDRRFAGAFSLVLVTQSALMLGFLVIVPATRPFHSADDLHKHSRSFLKELYPDRTVSPEQKSAYVAVVFALIRDGDNTAAERSIRFAAKQHFWNGSPYVIERLESDDDHLRASARAFLEEVAGKDYGPSREAWRVWWHDPPRPVQGMGHIGQRTLENVAPALVLAVGIIVWTGLRLLIGTPQFRWVGIWCLFLCPLFMVMSVVSDRIVGTIQSCTFDSETIQYYASHGVVLGLEDARCGEGGGLFGLYILGLIVYAAIGVFFGFLDARRQRMPRHGRAGAGSGAIGNG